MKYPRFGLDNEEGYGMYKKGVIVGIILLFIGVAVAPSINFNVVTASQDFI
ncbi:MAG: hypothetical protein V1726_08065 [Methanobacteriota archaeon]